MLYASKYVDIRRQVIITLGCAFILWLLWLHIFFKFF